MDEGPGTASASAAPAHRLICYECHKPQQLCVCAIVPRVHNRTQVLVLQHPRERLHPIGTARFVRLGLERARVEVAWNAGVREETPPPWAPPGAALLYPGPGARDLGELSPAERPAHLVVIDGTWHTARTLFRDKAWLKALPRVRLSPAAPSNYRIRREPTLDSLSTIEAIVQALRILEPETRGLEELLGAFDAMIDAQLGYVHRGRATPRLRERRPVERRRLPRALVEDFDRLVVAYMESARPDPRGPRCLTQLVAVSLATGKTFERLRLPVFGLPGIAHLDHMQLTPADFSAAVDAGQLRRDFQAFIDEQPGALVAAWNQTSLDLLSSELGCTPSSVSLKSAYRNVHGGGCGSLDEVVDKERLRPEALPFRGRAAVRVGRAVAIAHHLNALAHKR